MDSKIKNIKIKDGGNTKQFAIRLFGCLEGLEFIDKLVGEFAKFGQKGTDAPKISIRAIMSELLPLATYVGGDGQPVDTMSFDKLESYIESPVSALELSLAILEHQMVFIKESEQFRPYLKDVKSMFNIPSSDSTTKSE